MTYWLDYSDAKLSGQTIRAAGYTGVIRYIDSPANLATKHTNLDEYRSHLAAGLVVLLVMQTTQTASSGGYAAGKDHAARALAGAQLLGYSGPIFFTNDRPEVPQPAAWRSYLDGAASVLGIQRVGAYGFRNAMDLAVGHATYFWQAGRRSDVASHTHIWQDNNTQVTVGGITCDRNLILKDPTGGFLMALTDAQQQNLYDRIMGILPQKYFATDADGKVTEVSASAPGAKPAIVLNELHGNYLVNAVQAVVDRVDALEAKVAQPAPVQVDVAQLEAALAPAVAQAVADVARKLRLEVAE